VVRARRFAGFQVLGRMTRAANIDCSVRGEASTRPNRAGLTTTPTTARKNHPLFVGAPDGHTLRVSKFCSAELHVFSKC
jgi:hypothetical protein